MNTTLKPYQNNNRIYLFDNVKWLAIVMVVVGHAIGFLTDAAGNQFEKNLFVIIYSVHMPLFIFISGLFIKPMNKDTKIPKDKIIAFLAIGMVLRVFTAILRILLGKSNYFYSVLDMYDSYTWFMGAMAVMIFLTWLLRSYSPKIIFPIALLIGCMAGYDKFLGDQFALMRIVVFFPVFLIGYYFTPEQILKLVSVKWLKIAAVLVIAGFVALCVLNKGFGETFRPLFTGRNRFTVLSKQAYPFAVFYRLASYGISALMGLSIMCLVPNRSLGYITKMGAKTLQIYFWHKMVLITMEHFQVYKMLQSRIGDTYATAVYILLAIGVAFVCSIPPLAFPTKQILGIGTKAKHS